MALDNWVNLKAAVADWLGRTDLTTPIANDYIPLAEAEITRRVRRMTASTTVTIATASLTGPADLAEPISLRLSSGSPSLDMPLRLCTPAMLAEVRARNNDVAARPTHYAFYALQLQFAPVPDQSYSGILVYYQQMTALSGTNASNTVLAQAPDAYLYGALLASARYLEHDERVPQWQQAFNAAIEQLNTVADRESYAGSISDARLPIVFG